MRIVSENTDEDLKKARLQESVEWAARDLAANLLRVVRGAGRPYDLVRQAADFVMASRDFRDVHQVWPYNEIAAAVGRPGYEPSSGRTEGELYIELGQEAAIRGALQIVASELLDQRTQVRAGESELFEGIRSIEEGRELNRRARAASASGQVPVRRKPAAKKRSKPKT